MRVFYRIIIFVFFALIFVSKPVTVGASVATETIKNIGSFYAESTRSLFEQTSQKVYEVKDFYAPLVVDTSKTFKGIFDGAYIASDTILNSVVALGRATLDSSTYQITHTGEVVGDVVVSANTTFDNVKKTLSSKASGVINTTNVAVNNLVKEVATNVSRPKDLTPKIELKSPEAKISHIENIASAKPAIHFVIPDPRDLGHKVLNVYSNIGNEFLDAVTYNANRTLESWSGAVQNTDEVIGFINQNIDQATVALGNAGYLGTKNVLDGGNLIGNTVLSGSEKAIMVAGDTLAKAFVSTEKIASESKALLSNSFVATHDAISTTKNISVASVGSIWNFIIDKISDPLVPLFVSTKSNPEPIKVIGTKNNSIKDSVASRPASTGLSQNNTGSNNSIVERVYEKSTYFTTDNSYLINNLRAELLALNTDTLNILTNRIANQGYYGGQGISNTITNVITSGSKDINANTLTVGDLDGVLVGSRGSVSASSNLPISLGGTGTSTAPTYGQLLIGNSNGFYDLVSTSTLGISAGGDYLTLSDWYATTTNALAEGSTNLYFTNDRADARVVSVLSATTTLPNILTLAGLSSFGSSGATTTSAGDLDVSGNINFTGALLQNGSPFVGSQWATSGSDIYYNTGKVGIGTTTPYGQLSVNPNGITGPSFVVGSSTATDFIVTNAGNVGIGTASPAVRLNVLGESGVTNIARFTGNNTTSGNAGISIYNGNATPQNSIYIRTDQNRVGVFTVYGTDLYFNLDDSGAKNYHYYSGGIEKMTFNSSGNLGIGSTTPFATLAVNPVAGAASNQFVVGSSTATNFIVTNGGNVGIGTANPGAKLTVSNSANTELVRFVGYDPQPTLYHLKLTPSVGPATVTYNWQTVDNSGGTKNVLSFQGLTGNVGIGSTTPYGQLSVNPSGITGPSFVVGSSTATNFIIDNSGNVGIGTTSPAVKLDVWGTASVKNSTNLKGINISAGNSGGTPTLVFTRSDSSGDLTLDTNSSFIFAKTIISPGGVRFGPTSGLIDINGVASLTLRAPTGNSIFFQTNGSNTRMTVSSDGNVGISTTSPWKKLSVTGDLSLTGGIFDSTASSGSNGYVLQSTGTGIQWVATSTLGITGGGGGGSGTVNSGTAGQVAFYDTTGTAVSGTSTLFFSNGNIGIGTTTPYGQLSVNPNGITGPSFVVGSSTATNFIVTNAGNVGIGTASPAVRLNVLGESGVTNIARFTGNNTTSGNAGISIYNGNATPQDSIYIRTNQNRVGVFTVYGTDLYFNLDDSGAKNYHYYSGGIEKMTFNSSGNLGIGSTTPFATLAVNPVAGAASNQFVVGSSTATSFVVTNSSNVGVGTVSPQARLEVSGTESAGSGINIRVSNTNTGGSSYAGLQLKVGSGSEGGGLTGSLQSVSAFGLVNGLTLSPGTASQDIGFRTGTALSGGASGPAMIIKSSGKVGIGTPNPDAKLTIGTPGATYTDFGITSDSRIAVVNGSGNSAALILRSYGTYAAVEGFNYLTLSVMPTVINPGAGGGNVGVGTTTPAAKFAVSGAGFFDGNVLASNFTSTSTTLTSAFSGPVSISGAGTATKLSVSAGATMNTNLASLSSAYNIGAGSLLSLTYGGADGGRPLSITDSSYNTGSLLITRTSGAVTTSSPVSGFLVNATYQHTNTSVIGRGGQITAINNTSPTGILYGLDISATANLATSVGLNISVGSSGGRAYAALFNGGNVGIGTTTPSAKLSITQSANTNAGGLWIAETGNTDFRSVFMDTSGVMSFYGGDTGGTLNTATLNAAGEWTNASDRIYKENIEDLSYGLDEIMRIQPRSYNIKNSDLKRIGFIAQEMELVIPEVVAGEEGSKGISYGNLVAVTIKAIQELKTKLDTIQSELASVFSWFDGGKLNIKDDICVDDVCVTKEAFKQMLLNNGASHTTGVTNTNTNTGDTGSTTDSTSTSTTTSTGSDQSTTTTDTTTGTTGNTDTTTTTTDTTTSGSDTTTGSEGTGATTTPEPSTPPPAEPTPASETTTP